MAFAGCSTEPGAPSAETQRTAFRAAVAPLFAASPCPEAVPPTLATRQLALSQRHIALQQRIASDPAMTAEARIVADAQARRDKIMLEAECAVPHSDYTPTEIEAASRRLDRREQMLADAERAVATFKPQAES